MELQNALGISGFCIAFVLLIKEIVLLIFFLKSRPKIKIEISSVSHRFRDRTKIEENASIYGKELGEGCYKIPKKIFRVKVGFYITNEGEKAIGIKDVYLRWKNPKIKGLSKYYHVCFDSCLASFDVKRKYLKIEGGQQIHLNLVQEPEARLQILLFKKNLFKHKIESVGLADHEYFEKLPRTIFMEIVVIDQKGKVHISEFDLCMS